MVKTLATKSVLVILAIAWLSSSLVTPAHSEIRYTDNRLTIKGDTAVIGTGEVIIDAGHIIIENGTVISDKANLIINNKSTGE